MNETLNLPPFPELTYDTYYWWAHIILKTWAGFRVDPRCHNIKDMAKVSDGSTTLAVTAPDDHQAPPSPEQAAAYAYLIEHEESTHDSMLQAIFEEYPSRREAYGYDEEDCMPELSSPDQLKMLIGLGEVVVLKANKNGVAYIRFDLRAAWDAEHGFNITMHKDRAIQVGYTGDGEYHAEDDAKLES